MRKSIYYNRNYLFSSLKVTIQTSSDSAFESSTDLVTSELALSELKVGKTFPITFLPRGNMGYMRLMFSTVGTATAGKITSGVVAGNGLSINEI